MYDNPWQYHGADFDAPTGYYGMIYLITNTVTNRLYVGRKAFFEVRKRKNAAGKIKRTTHDTKWRSYYGSCDPLNADVATLGADKFKREILFLCKTKKEASLLEEKEQWDRDVLLTDDYYNTNIAGRYFARDRVTAEGAIQREVTKLNETWRQIKRERMTGEQNTAKRPEVRAKIKAAIAKFNPHIGSTISEDHKAALRKGASEKNRKRIRAEDGTLYDSQIEYLAATGATMFAFYRDLKAGKIEYLPRA